MIFNNGLNFNRSPILIAGRKICNINHAITNGIKTLLVMCKTKHNAIADKNPINPNIIFMIDFSNLLNQKQPPIQAD